VRGSAGGRGGANGREPILVFPLTHPPPTRSQPHPPTPPGERAQRRGATRTWCRCGPALSTQTRSTPAAAAASGPPTTGFLRLSVVGVGNSSAAWSWRKKARARGFVVEGARGVALDWPARGKALYGARPPRARVRDSACGVYAHNLT
jgi:hypothetical protein